MVLLAENACKLTFSILHLMSLINNDVLPVVLVEPEPILEDEIVCCNAHIPFGCFHHLLNLSSCCWTTSVYYLTDGRRPLIELRHPVGDGR